MNVVTKLTASALCFFIASKLEASSAAAKQAARANAVAEQKKAIEQQAENLLAAANTLKESFYLIDSQEQKINQAIRLINDTKMFHLDSSKMANLNNAKNIIEQVYNAVK